MSFGAEYQYQKRFFYKVYIDFTMRFSSDMEINFRIC